MQYLLYGVFFPLLKNGQVHQLVVDKIQLPGLVLTSLLFRVCHWIHLTLCTVLILFPLFPKYLSQISREPDL